ncbi:hypothetical protein [Frankia sp. Cas3]|uniref:hypothetical protein n=1 Tax=Frankia sp. Cas3 TaxID=3073926 RepID=UPI002AD42EBA|nr:hypothetical protein [Frankia sp. Cas3]
MPVDGTDRHTGAPGDSFQRCVDAMFGKDVTRSQYDQITVTLCVATQYALSTI